MLQAATPRQLEVDSRTMDEEFEHDGVDVEECDEDIYGDLEYDVFAPIAKKPKYDETVFQDQYENLVTENNALKERIKQVEKANRTYASNISSLYLTAKNEVDKKNHIIKNLTEKLKQVTKSKSTLSKEETEVILVRCQEAYLESQSKVTLQEIKKSLRDVSPSKAGKRKLVRFGNMSVYFFRDQGCFEREETVDFPTGNASSKKKDNERNHTPASTPTDEAVSQRNHSMEGHSEVPVNIRSQSDDHNRRNMNKVPPPEIKSPQLPPPLNESRRNHRKSVDDEVGRSGSDQDRDLSRQPGQTRPRSNERTRDYNRDRGNRDDDRRDGRYEDRDRGNRYNKEYDSRKSDSLRDRNSYRDSDYRTRSGRISNRPSNDSKHSSSNHRKNHRSRSKSR